MDSSSSGVTRKRSLRACDGCRHRRMKCEDLQTSPNGARQSCKVCRENREACTFNDPVRKRGPRPGWRLRAQNSPENSKSDLRSDMQTDTHAGPSALRINNPTSSQGFQPPLSAASNIPLHPQDDEHHSSPPPALGQNPTSKSRPRLPLMGLPTSLVDQLLAVYFTHVHAKEAQPGLSGRFRAIIDAQNVWPLIYKPMFHPHTTSPPLLLAMLAIAACVAPTPEIQSHQGIDKEKLFQMAESALHRCRLECRIDIIQSLILLSLRQTGCGDKHSAFTYAGRACCMALNLGLNLAPAAFESPPDSELRARVYWNCYVLDKTLAEETGRSFLLPYRRSSTPLPSINEVDEFETWPPLPTSALPLPRSVRHIVPRRGYVMSCFVWTCYLAMVVENILDLDVVGPPAPHDPHPWLQQFTASLTDDRGEAFARAERIASQLEGWRNALPRHLDIDLSPNVSPLPHHVVGLAWYHSAQILLHSRFIKRRHLFPAQDKTEEEMAARTHATCSKAAESVIELLAHLDRHRLLSQTSSDVIHILSLATLFEAFDASDPNEALAERAKINFAQCCIWLRDCSSSWPTASAHKLFFEGLIQGGLKLSNSEELANAPGVSPQSSSFVGSPQMPDGLRAIGRNLSVSEGMSVKPCLPSLGISSLFQLPQFYWNHLTNSIPGQQPQLDSTAFDFMLGSPDVNNNMGMGLPDWSTPGPRTPLVAPGPTAASSSTGPSKILNLGDQQQTSQSPAISLDQALEQDPGPGGLANSQVPYVQNLDPSTVYSVLMSFMVEAARSQ